MEDSKTLFCSSKLPWASRTISKFIGIWELPSKSFASPVLGRFGHTHFSVYDQFLVTYMLVLLMVTINILFCGANLIMIISLLMSEMVLSFLYMLMWNFVNFFGCSLGLFLTYDMRGCFYEQFQHQYSLDILCVTWLHTDHLWLVSTASVIVEMALCLNLLGIFLFWLVFFQLLTSCVNCFQ